MGHLDCSSEYLRDALPLLAGYIEHQVEATQDGQHASREHKLGNAGDHDIDEQHVRRVG